MMFSICIGLFSFIGCLLVYGTSGQLRNIGFGICLACVCCLFIKFLMYCFQKNTK